jgi:hypothetical protein
MATYTHQAASTRQPTLVAQGSNDVIIPTHNFYVRQQSLPFPSLPSYK